MDNNNKSSTKKSLMSIFVLIMFFFFVLSTIVPIAQAATFGLTSIGSTSYPTANIGTTNTGASLNSPNVLMADKYTTTVPLTATTIKTYGTTNSNIKVSIYDDNAGDPGNPLFTEVAGAGTANSWSTITIPNTYLAAGTYWVVINIQTGNGVGRRDGVSGALRKFRGTTPFTYAYATAFPSSGGTWTNAAAGTQNAAYIVGVPVEGYAKATTATLSANNAVMNSVAFYSHATGNFRLAIYSDSSGPSSKLWESASTAATASAWSTVNISSGTPASLILNSGTYWLAWQWDSANNGPSYTLGSAGDGNYITQAYDVFPSSWSGGTSSSEKYSVYVNYTPDTTPPTVTSVAVQSLTTINVTFSEAMGTGSTTAANYTISESGQGTLAANPSTVSYVSSTTVQLSWSSGALANAADVTITVANAQDLAGNVISTPNSGIYIIRAILDFGTKVRDFVAGAKNHFHFH